jgi:hypothetical protein
MAKLKSLSTENVYATYHANPYKPGYTLSVEAERANLEEAKRLVLWLEKFIHQEEAK